MCVCVYIYIYIYAYVYIHTYIYAILHTNIWIPWWNYTWTMEFNRVVSFLHLLVKTSQFLGYVVLECVGFLPFTSLNTSVSFRGLFYPPTLAGECCAVPRMSLASLYTLSFSDLIHSLIVNNNLHLDRNTLYKCNAYFYPEGISFISIYFLDFSNWTWQVSLKWAFIYK